MFLYSSQDPAVAVGGDNNPAAGRGESFLAVTKALIVRAMIIYFITSMFRRPQPVDVKSGGGAVGVLAPSTNLYANGTMMVDFLLVCLMQ